MKADEHRELPAEGLAERLEEIREEYFNLRFQNATGQLENFSQLGQRKREIARILTVMRERELGIEIEAKQPETKKKWRKTRPALEEEEAPEALEATEEDEEEEESSTREEESSSETPASPPVTASASTPKRSKGEGKKASDG